MQKQEVPHFLITQPSQMPLHRQLLDGLRRYAFATVATLVVIAYLGVLYLFSHQYAQDASDLAAFSFDVSEAAPKNTAHAAPMRPTGLGTIDSIDARHAWQPGTSASDSSVLGSRLLSDSTASPARVSSMSVRAGSTHTVTPGPQPPSIRQASGHSAKADEASPARPDKARRAAKQQPPVRNTKETPGTLLVTSQPAGARVTLNGEEIGQTPLTATDVAPGLHKIELQSAGYAPYATRVIVKSDETSTLHGQLSVPVGPLEVWIEPQGAIYIDDVLHRQNVEGSYTTRLPVGPHRIKAVHPTRGSWENVVYVSEDQPRQVVIIFNEAAAANGDHNRAEKTQGSEPVQAPDEPASLQPDADAVYAVAEEPPQLIGGLEALHGKIRYPEKAYQAGLQGRVYVQFVVDEEGQVREARVVRGLGLGCSAEALRAVKQARFRPGKVGGVPVKVRYTLPIDFRIGD